MGTGPGLLNGQSDRLTDYPAVGLSIAHTPANARVTMDRNGHQPGKGWSHLPGGMGVDVQGWHAVTAGLMVAAAAARWRDGLMKLKGNPGRARTAGQLPENQSGRATLDCQQAERTACRVFPNQ